MTHKDPIASLAPAAIVVSLGGVEYTTPVLTAYDWLKVLLQPTPDLLGVLPALLQPGDREVVEEQILTAVVSYEEVQQAAYDALEVASGRDWWFVVKLCAFTYVAWDNIGGALARSRIDVTSISIGAWVDAAFHICCEQIANNGGKDAKQNLTRFISELETPPPGVEIEFDEEAEALAFERSLQRFG